jgi:hypothetical protein
MTNCAGQLFTPAGAEWFSFATYINRMRGFYCQGQNLSKLCWGEDKKPEKAS